MYDFAETRQSALENESLSHEERMMKKWEDAPVDVALRYTIAEASAYLRISRVSESSAEAKGALFALTPWRCRSSPLMAPGHPLHRLGDGSTSGFP